MLHSPVLHVLAPHAGVSSELAAVHCLSKSDVLDRSVLPSRHVLPQVASADEAGGEAGDAEAGNPEVYFGFYIATYTGDGIEPAVGQISFQPPRP